MRDYEPDELPDRATARAAGYETDFDVVKFRHLPLSAAVQKLFRHVPKVRRFHQFAILLQPVLNAFPVD